MSQPPTPIRQMLDKTVWARALTAPQLARVEQEVVLKSVPAGGYVCSKGEPVDYWIGVNEGLLKMSSVSPEGKTVTFTGLLAGGWFGEGSLLKNELRKYDVVALRDSSVGYMPRATFQWLIDSSISFNHFLLQQLNERLAFFISMVAYDRMLEPDARVACCLAALFNPHLNPASGRELQISQEEIGYLCGTSRQRANQALQLLEKAGLLKVDYGSITILDLDGLRRFQP
ncbi:MAG: Crp/Fnr family transcriptional regulator [Burkholderiaceae bacterium]